MIKYVCSCLRPGWLLTAWIIFIRQSSLVITTLFLFCCFTGGIERINNYAYNNKIVFIFITTINYDAGVELLLIINETRF